MDLVPHKKMERQQKGFTLIELLIVVAIIGILAAVGATLIPRVLENTKRTTADALCHQFIKEVKTIWTGCSAGIPAYLYNPSPKKIDTNSDWCTFNPSTDITATAFVGHFRDTFVNPYRTNVEAVHTSGPLDDKMTPACNELFGHDKDNSSCGHCKPPIKAGEFVFQCYNLDSNGKLTKYREHFQTR